MRNAKSLESIGNKSLLEKRINIRASDYRLQDKVKYYRGYTDKRGTKEATNIHELLNIANKLDFTEEDIYSIEEKIFGSFIEFLNENSLLLDF